MYDLDPAQLPPAIASLVFSRGRGVPPLQWTGRPNPLAARSLGELDDAKLFQRLGLANEAMASAVRALLYLWNGWPAEANQQVMTAPEAERNYIAAIGER
jgi:hypothetical protein